MHIGVCKLTLQIPENQTLKGKRSVLQSLCQRVRSKFGVSIAEVSSNHAWQIAVLGIACISNSARHADETLNNVVSYIETTRQDVQVLDIDQETISGF